MQPMVEVEVEVEVVLKGSGYPDGWTKLLQHCYKAREA